MNADPVVRRTVARPGFLVGIVVLSVATIVIFPLFIVLYQYPGMERLLREFTLSEAVGVATDLTSVLVPDDRELGAGTFAPAVVQRLARLEREANFFKLKIYSPEGRVLYSSDSREIGTLNREPYFQDILASRRTVAQEVERDSLSFESERMVTDVVEAYVPVVRGGRLLGVFELYYNVGPQKQQLRRLTGVSSGVLFAMAVVLLAAVAASASRARQYLLDRERVLEELRTLSLSDELTGIYNRRGFYILAEQQIKIARRTGRTMLLASADLDGLKRINDGFGHHEGDRALVDAAQILRESFRESDIIARMGGDEFVVLMSEKPEISSAILLERLARNLEAHNRKVTRPYPFSISVGFAYFDPKQPVSLGELLIQADKAMYERKGRRPGGA
ncbi:MAG: GGDEF domain-containing protein [Spirochaetales bacterium]|nr:GGDEF domain-containing protein [Spirochaetales bacterium]